VTNKCTIISQIITLLHVSTLSYHPQGVRSSLPSYTSMSNAVVGNIILNFNECYQLLHLTYSRNSALYQLRTRWEWYNSIETCRRIVI